MLKILSIILKLEVYVPSNKLVNINIYIVYGLILKLKLQTLNRLDKQKIVHNIIYTVLNFIRYHDIQYNMSSFSINYMLKLNT